jgi:hypothetical protein
MNRSSEVMSCRTTSGSAITPTGCTQKNDAVERPANP